MLIGDYLITLTDDSGVERSDMDGNEVICKGYFCEVYDKSDIDYTNRLDYFCIAKGFEYQNDTDEDIMKAVRTYLGYDTIETCETLTAERATYLLGRAMCYIGEYDLGVDLYDTFHEIIGMTDSEIAEMGFTSLSEYFRESSNDTPELTM